jgi:hypothetical protein
MRTVSWMLALVVATVPLPALAVGEVVVWEHGTLSGSDLYTSPTTGQVSGAVTLAPGEDDVPGVDYFSQNPGSFTFTGSGTFSGTLSGTFRFPTSGTRTIFGGISAIFSVVPAVFQVGSRVEVDGSVDPLLIDPPLAPFPDTLEDPRLEASLSVTQILFASGIPVGFTFSGPVTFTAFYVPEPPTGSERFCAGLIVAAIGFRRRRRARGAQRIRYGRCQQVASALGL